MSLLILLLLVPVVSGLAVAALPADGAVRPRTLAIAAVAVQLLLGGLCWLQQPADLAIAWLPKLGLALELGLDGLSLPVVLLTTLLTMLVLLASPADQARPRLYVSLLLATNLGLVGAFMAQNALLFLLAFELVLIPTTLLVAIWGRANGRGAAIRYLLFGAVSGLALLAAVLALGWLAQPVGDAAAGMTLFSFQTLANASFSPSAGHWILALLLLSFGLKLPIVPLHGWQPITYAEAPIPVVMLLSGSVSKLGAYGLLRFGVGLLPDAWASFSPWIAAAAAVSAVYGALNAIAQTDIRRVMAYSALGHMGLLTLALAAATPMSLQGAVAQILAQGLITALLFSCVGLIERKTGTTSIPELSGLMNPIRGLPFTTGMLLLALMAAAGIPGLAGFPAELLVFEGSWVTFPRATLVCLVASGFTAVYAVRLFNRVGFGRLDNDRADWLATTWGERAPAIVLSVLVLFTGIRPDLLTGWSESTTAFLALRQATGTTSTLISRSTAAAPVIAAALLPPAPAFSSAATKELLA